MKKTFRALWFVTFILLNSACSTAIEQKSMEPSRSSDQATGTAIVADKYTHIAESTLHPATPFPTEVYPTEDWTGWTPSSNEIVASDRGKAFDFLLTSRFSIVLKESEYPPANLELDCTPENVLGQVSNVEGVPPDYYVIRYEGASLGECTIRNGPFEVTIHVVDQSSKITPTSTPN